MKGTPAAASAAAWPTIASRPSGATTASEYARSVGIAISCARLIAPGWNAVIWLSSMSVVMYACAV